MSVLLEDMPTVTNASSSHAVGATVGAVAGIDWARHFRLSGQHGGQHSGQSGQTGQSSAEGSPMSTHQSPPLPTSARPSPGGRATGSPLGVSHHNHGGSFGGNHDGNGSHSSHPQQHQHQHHNQQSHQHNHQHQLSLVPAGGSDGNVSGAPLSAPAELEHHQRQPHQPQHSQHPQHHPNGPGYHPGGHPNHPNHPQQVHQHPHAHQHSHPSPVFLHQAHPHSQPHPQNIQLQSHPQYSFPPPPSPYQRGPANFNLPVDQFGLSQPHQHLDPSVAAALHFHGVASSVTQAPSASSSAAFHTQLPQSQGQSHSQSHIHPSEDPSVLPVLKQEARSPSSAPSQVPPPTPITPSPFQNQHQNLPQSQSSQGAGRTTASPMNGQVAVLSPHQQHPHQHNNPASVPVSLSQDASVPRAMNQPKPPSPEASKKRSRTDSDQGKDGTPEDEPAKKAKPPRGRPRLTGVGETPNERRRKQIREAQRAYRNRKDKAITDLEEKVKRLEETNTLMTQEFSGFLELLQSQGIQNVHPEVSNRLQNISQKFFSRSSPEQGRGGSDEQQHSGGSSSAEQDKMPAAAIQQQQQQQQPQQQYQQQQPQQLMLQTPQQQFGRRNTLATASTASSDQYTALPSAVRSRPTAQDAAHSFASSATSFMPLEAMSYEVIAQPTPENASYPSYTPDASGGWVEQAPLLNYHPVLPPGPPPLQAPYSPPEETFGRRLHLATLRRALLLASMPEPPPERFGAVYGFCLMYESRQDIINRVTEQIEAVRQAPMDNWEAFFPTQYSYPKRITELPGYEGEAFVDSEKVEVYLRERGIHIPGSAQFVDAEIVESNWMSAEETGTVPVTTNQRSQSSQSPPAQPQGPVGTVWQPRSAQNAAANADANSITPMFTDRSATGAADTGAMNPFLCPAVPVESWTSTSPPKFKVTLNVSVLVEEVISKSLCLGRTPGLRPRDVDRAVKIASGLFQARR